MKKLLFLLVITFSVLMAKADTISYWHVYYNDLCIAELNGHFSDTIISIKHADIKKNDSISIIFTNDYQCSYCSYIVSVFYGNKYIKSVTNNSNWPGRFSFSLLKLFEAVDLKKCRPLSFYYVQTSNEEKASKPQLLFELFFK